MASVEVISKAVVSSKNKKNLETGRRMLEEFRKKKAQSKNGKSKNKPSTNDSTTNERYASENGQAFIVDSEKFSSHYNGSELIPQAHINTQGKNRHKIQGVSYQKDSDFTHQMGQSVGNGYLSTEIGEGKYMDVISFSVQDFSSNNSHSYLFEFDKDVNSSVSYGGTNVISNDDSTKGYTEGFLTNIAHKEPDSTNSTIKLPVSTPELGHTHLGSKNQLFDLEGRKNFETSKSQQISESYSTGFNSIVGGLTNGPTYSTMNESYIRRSRPSFLDSLNIKDSSISGQSPVNDEITNNKPSEIQNPFVRSSTTDFFNDASKGHKLFEQSLENKLEFSSQKQNEDFAALEQHIEDLTQEKFSLQRALEASKGLAESLAAENSSLTESYNHQASTVSQLKADMERLHEEIKARLVELEAVKTEYVNAQLECNAADERAKLLASEVISLEEKALRLRSSELKLEREIKNSSAEIVSYKKKVSTLDKERRDLLQTIDALQEEKKLLQSKLRRASTSGISIDHNKGNAKKDVSTSTNDLDLDAFDSSEQASRSTEMHDNANNLELLQNFIADHENFASSIPLDQVQTIQNIDSLISEILSEKEELMQALITQVSTSTKLKELNKELSQKLEVQTQRLELLTAQNMSSELVTTKKPNHSEIIRESVAYTDEGDEVVERVLGWIMKLFPGGPSKRRTSRL